MSKTPGFNSDRCPPYWADLVCPPYLLISIFVYVGKHVCNVCMYQYLQVYIHYIYCIYIYIDISWHIQFNILCRGVAGLIPYEDELKLRSRSISLFIYIYVCVCVLCECLYIYISKGVTDFTPYEAKFKLLSRSIMFNIYCSEGVGGFDPLRILRQVVGERPGFFQRSLPGIWAADATSPSNQAADTQPQLRLGDPIYRWLFLAWELPS